MPESLVPTDFVDAHLHVWDPGRLRYPWLTGEVGLERRFDLNVLDDHRKGADPQQVVFVQAEAHPDDARMEVRVVREIAQRDARLTAMVAWAPLEQGDGVRPWLEELSADGLVRGIRRLLQDEEDPRFCLQDSFRRGVALLADFGFTFDICIRHHQLRAATELVAATPEVTFVLDHLGKPAIADGQLEPWGSELAELARLPNVFAKLSGLTTEAKPGEWTPEDLAPYLQRALELFGPDRLMFGSDWPVMTMASDYPSWVEVVAKACAGLSSAGRRAIFADNARRIYRIPVL